MSPWINVGKIELPTDVQVGTFIDARKGTPGGIASLDAAGTIPDEQLPERLSSDGIRAVAASVSKGSFAPAAADQRGAFGVIVTDGCVYHHNSDAKAGSATSATYKTKHTVFSDATRPTMSFANSTDLSVAPGAGAGSPQPYQMAASLILPDGSIRRATVGGALTWTVQPGEATTTDPIENVTLVAGTTVFVLTYVSTAVANGWRAGYLISNAAVLADGIGRVYGSDATATGTGITGSTDTGAFYAFGPSVISGRTAAPTRAVAIVADSIGFGVGAAQATYPKSFILDPLRAGRVPYLQLSRSGSTLDQANNSPTLLERILAGRATTDAVLELATNDLSNGKTAEQVKGASLLLAQELRSSGVARVWRTTVTPRSSGAVGSQTPHASNVHRQAFNAWLRAGAPIDPGSLAPVAIGTPGALIAGYGGHPFAGVLDMAALVEEGITGTWRAAFYGDGLHPNDAGHTALATAVRADIFGGLSTTPKNYLSGWFPKKIYSSVAGAQLPSGRLHFVPVHVADAAVRVDRLVANCSNAGSADGLVRAAIYAADAQGRPAQLVADLGAKAPVYGVMNFDPAAPVTLQPGRYFMAFISQGAPATAPSFLTATGADPLVTGDTSWVVPASNAYITNGIADGAVPATVASTIYSNAAPFLQLRAV